LFLYFQRQTEVEVVCCCFESYCANTPADTPKMFESAPALKMKSLFPQSQKHFLSVEYRDIRLGPSQ